MKSFALAVIVMLAGTIAGRAWAQESADGVSFDAAAAATQQQLRDALDELSTLREAIAAEKLPLSRQLNSLERELIEVRQAFQEASRLVDNRTLDLNTLRNEIRSRHEEATYLANLLGEYARNWESRLHIAELQRYRERLEAAHLAADSAGGSSREALGVQLELASISLERLHEAMGGARFDGSAVAPDGMMSAGTFVMIGPAAVFRSTDGQYVGTAEQRLGSLEPTVIAFDIAEDIAAAGAFLTAAPGAEVDLPIDPTLGNAHKIAAIDETLWEEIKKGGPVMIPIFILAGVALLISLYKWLRLAFIRAPSSQRITALLLAVARNDEAAAMREARGISGPTGAMLMAGVRHLDKPRELIEEVMYESVLSTRLKLNHLLPFIAVCASAAPLLGLLGTVTGIMNTFTLITVFGTGDVKTLSSGISEALITTKFGLIVAIPSLLMYAFLSRRARAVIDQMEKSAVGFVSQVSRTSEPRSEPMVSGDTDAARASTQSTEAPGSATTEQVREILVDLLAPKARLGIETTVRRPAVAPAEGAPATASTP